MHTRTLIIKCKKAERYSLRRLIEKTFSSFLILKHFLQKNDFRFHSNTDILQKMEFTRTFKYNNSNTKVFNEKFRPYTESNIFDITFLG